jgi:hypothetical protein
MRSRVWRLHPDRTSASPGYVPPPTPLPPPVLNPSGPYTVPQPSYQPITPTTPSTTPSTPSTVPSEPTTVPSGEVRSRVNEEPSSTTARSEGTSVAKTRSVHHHHRGRYIGMGPTLGSFYCPYGWCVRIFSSVYLLPAIMAGIAIEDSLNNLFALSGIAMLLHRNAMDRFIFTFETRNFGCNVVTT